MMSGEKKRNVCAYEYCSEWFRPNETERPKGMWITVNPETTRQPCLMDRANQSMAKEAASLASARLVVPPEYSEQGPLDEHRQR